MVLSYEDKIIIQNDYEEKGWTAYKIWKVHETKNWNYSSVKRLIKKLKETGTVKNDGAPSHRAKSVQEFLEKKLKRRFIRAEEWPPSSPDINPLDYFYWDFVKTKVYEGRFGNAFESEKALKKRIKQVWKECAKDLVTIRKSIKQFVPRLKAIEEKRGKCIKMLFT